MTDLDEEAAPGAPEAGGPESAPRRRRVVVVVVVVLLAGLGTGLGLALGGGTTSGPKGPEGVALQLVPDLASADTTASGAPVDGITCRTGADQAVKYHIHVLVQIFVGGHQERIPAGVGIPPPRLTEHFPTGTFYDNGLQGCLYWLHIHTVDGVVHVESPYRHTFTLGQFFDIWRQPLGPGQVGPARGTVVAFENGRRFAGDPRDIPLLPHGVIQLDVGAPVVPYRPVQFSVAGLCGAGTNGCASSGG